MEHFKELFAVVGAGIGVLTGLLTLYIKLNEVRKLRQPPPETTAPSATTTPPTETPQHAPVRQTPLVETDWIPLTPASDSSEVRRAKAIPVVPVAYPPTRKPRPSSPSKRVIPFGPSQELIASIKTPALMMIVIGIMSVLSNLTFAGYGIVDQFVTPLSDQTQADLPPQKFSQERFQHRGEKMQTQEENLIAILFFVGMAIASACSVLAGFGMHQMSGYSLSILGSVAIMVSTFGCCFLGVPVGIWCLIVLFDAKVRDAFQS